MGKTTIKEIEFYDGSEKVDLSIKLSKEEQETLLEACKSKRQVGFLVDQYYQSQQYRITAENQARSLMQMVDFAADETSNQPLFITKSIDMAKAQEALNCSYMDFITKHIPICKWLRSIKGVGPVLAAYLYATFDVEKGRYATDFLSYAGLNDNNNPWLGKEKGTALAKEALKYRDDQMAPTRTLLRNLVDEYRVGDKDLDDLFEKFEKKIKPLNIKEDNIAEEIVTRLQSVLGKKAILDDEYITRQVTDNYTDICDYISILKNPKACTDIMIGYCADKAHRRPRKVKEGVYNNWRSKSAKTKEPTVDDLASYLAKPPYNPDAKKQMYVLGDMFIRNSNRGSLYGEIYKARKEEETIRNERGEFAKQAKHELESKTWSDKTSETYKALEQGKLSKAHINMRARRYAEKLFLSHVYEAMYFEHFREEAPMPYIIAIGGHHDYIAPEVDFKDYL